jgi:hypothetical protein
MDPLSATSMTEPSTFGERLHDFYASLRLDVQLPSGVSVMNPYTSSETMATVRAFTKKFYADNTPRLSCWGINPGRFGGGITGLSFTDPVVLRAVCGIETPVTARRKTQRETTQRETTQRETRRELSAEFVWSVVEAFGGADIFFAQIFLTALCPLGFVTISPKKPSGEPINYNFYDDPALFHAVKPFMIATIREQIALGLRTDVAVCFGTGKLHAAFDALNREHGFFGTIIPLAHPRFIMQYRRKELQQYRQNYITVLRDPLLVVP